MTLGDREAMWLPMGSVVRLKGATRLIVITGYLQYDPDAREMWDYAGLPHPEGWTSSEGSLVFNREDIEMVMGIGYLDPDGERFLQELAAQEQKIADMKAAAARGDLVREE